MSGLGKQLKEARERMHVTVTAAASATHLKLLVIDAKSDGRAQNRSGIVRISDLVERQDQPGLFQPFERYGRRSLVP